MIKNYQDWIVPLRDATLHPESPIVQKNGNWRILQRKQAWQALAPKMFDEHLDRFRQVGVDVLRERDPQFELVPEQRFAAQIHGKSLKFSGSLRKGVAETFALLGSFPQYLTSCSDGKGTMIASLAVWEILNDVDWILWASLDRQLPMLAEAAPNQFLEAVEKAINKNPSPFVQVYAQEAPGVMGRNHMTGLLWALETLAWFPEYFVRVIVILGDLAVIDPGGNWANRPANSISDILLPWKPHTHADFAKRKTAVVTLLQEHPDIGWATLLGLLPTAHSVTSGTNKPVWRELNLKEDAGEVTTKEYWEQISNYAQLAIDVAANDYTKLPALIQMLPVLPSQEHFKLLELLASTVVTGLSEPDRWPIWDALVSLAKDHRKFSDAEWAMPTDTVTKIEEVAAKLAPVSASLRYRHLFNAQAFSRFYDDAEGDYEQKQKTLGLLQEKAIHEITAESGIQGILDFVKFVSLNSRVGNILGGREESSFDEVLLPELLLSSDRQTKDFIAGFIWGRFRSKGWEWVNQCIDPLWDNEQKSVFLSCLPFNAETWSRVKELLGANESSYWSLIGAHTYYAPDADLIAGVEKLLQYDQVRAAMEHLEQMTYQEKSMPVEIVVQALQKNLTSYYPSAGINSNASRSLIKWLQDNPEVDEEQLFQIEWSYLPLLDRYSGNSPTLLFKRLGSDPNFYLAVIQAVFRSKNEVEPKGEPNEKQREIAENAFRLLHEWRVPPGCDKDGKLDDSAFKVWITTAKQLSHESGHFGVAMNQFGQVLSNYPADPDGLWIHKTVAEELNLKDSEEMRSGFTTGLFNKRGVHGFTSGREERKIAADYREKAEAVENVGFHRLATSLRALAMNYEEDATRQESRHGNNDSTD